MSSKPVDARWLRCAPENPEAEAEQISRNTHSALGRPGRVAGTRELVIPGSPYILPYRVRERRVEVLRVFRAARKWRLKL